jgi:endonuclease I
MKKLNALIFAFFISFSSFSTIPSGYYNNATGTGATLKTNLYNIIKGHTDIGYGWTAFITTDDKPNGKVWDMYSDIPGGTPPYEFTFGTDQCGTYNSEGDCYNREHSWPSSWFNDASPMYSDLFHLIPTDGYVNNRRANYILAKVGTASWTSMNSSKLGSCATAGYSGTVFEPIDAYKGDFARAYFYMVTRYENLVVGWSSNTTVSDILDGTTHPAFETWYLNLLAGWSVLDPVSQKEIDRNDAVYALQHNRNPYIDHPEYVLAVWGGQLTATPVSLSGFTYSSGAGPSPSQNYTLSGTALIPASGSVTVTGTPNFEVSTNNTSFSNSVTLSYTSGSLSPSIIYLRLKSGLAIGNYSNNLIVNSGGAIPVNVSCSGTVSSAFSPEPTNFPTDFSAHNIHLLWTDAAGPTLPNGYLIRMSSISFAAIPVPVDGIPVVNSQADKNIPFNTQEAWFTNLSPNTAYYFKMYSYTGAGNSIDYKTDGAIPQVQQNTTP